MGHSPPGPPIKVCLTSPPSPREKEVTAQATHQGDDQSEIERVCYKRTILTAKQPNDRKTVAYIVHPRGYHTIRPCH